MCTMTIIPLNDGFRVAFNRDESRKRPIAFPPRLVQCGRHTAAMPIDARSLGTWIAVNDAGIVMGILNRNIGLTRGSRDPNVPSRGTIIPLLAACETLNEARRTALALCDRPFAPFRLIFSDYVFAVEFVSEPTGVNIREYLLTSPVMFTSSGLGDDLVEPPRRKLFATSFTKAENWPSEQDAFHRHSWPDRRDLSVCMSREDASTVSLTTITVRGKSSVMTYHPGPPDEVSEETTLSCD